MDLVEVNCFVLDGGSEEEVKFALNQWYMGNIEECLIIRSKKRCLSEEKPTL